MKRTFTVFALLFAGAVISYAHGPSLPPDPWDAKPTHGPSLPPDPWDLHGLAR